ncbi:MAG: cadherin-like domain-containing protein [Thermoflexales bacterium]|nr:cadherin-like domain-containing protein [Thermoflexales bacterium]
MMLLVGLTCNVTPPAASQAGSEAGSAATRPSLPQAEETITAASQVKKLVAPDGAADTNFGISISISGDTLVVGAHRANAVYVFARNQGGTDNWGLVKKLTASDSKRGDYFGSSVSINGDTLAVGAYGVNIFQGAAYVFARNQGGTDNWGLVKKVVASDGAANDLFGRSVSISGGTIVAGAYQDRIGSNQQQGSAYVFSAAGDPIAVNDMFLVDQDSVLVVAAPGVLANDISAGDSLTATLEDGPGNGELAFKPDGSFTYTPTATYIGVDHFTYTAHEGMAASQTATVTLHVAVLKFIFLPVIIRAA